MKNKPNENQKKGSDTNASDDTLGENSEKTPLAKEVEKENKAREEGKSKKDK